MSTREIVIILAVAVVASVVIWYLFIDLQYPASPNPHTCDLNHDDTCDCEDFAIFQRAFGSCRGDMNYYFAADADESGCVDKRDRDQLFPGTRWDACATTTSWR